MSLTKYLGEWISYPSTIGDIISDALLLPRDLPVKSRKEVIRTLAYPIAELVTVPGTGYLVTGDSGVIVPLIFLVGAVRGTQLAIKGLQISITGYSEVKEAVRRMKQSKEEIEKQGCEMDWATVLQVEYRDQGE